MAKIRVLLIEDNRILRDGISAMINGHTDVTVAAVSEGREDTLSKARSVKPHLILIELGMNSSNGLDIVVSVKKEFPGIKIVGMGLAPTQPDIRNFIQAGADGFILQNATLDDVLKTIRAVASGENVLPPQMTGSLFYQVVEHSVTKVEKNFNHAARMTQREKEISALIVDGLSNKQIASQLNIATFTVKSHVHNILEKLAFHSRLQIANHARD